MSNQGKVGPLPTTTTHVAAAEVIRAAVLDGRFEPGERLKENDLAEMLGISRTPVREALFVLAAQGLVVVMPGRGVKVRSYTQDEMQCNYDMRSRLEAYAASRAAGRMKSKEIAAARKSIEEMRSLEPGDLGDLVTVNSRFHRILLDAAGDERLLFIVSSLLELPMSYKSHYWRTETHGRNRSADAHERILDAIEAEDATAAAVAMADHIDDAGKVLIKDYISGSDRGADSDPA
jgi:DNA-binding GntR family transcriptional regulator